MSLVNKICIVLLVIAGFIAAGFIGCAVGSSAGKHLIAENERIAGLLAVRDADLELARQSIDTVGKRAGAIGSGLDEAIKRANDIKDRNARIAELVKGIRACVSELEDIRRWTESGNHQAK